VDVVILAEAEKQVFMEMLEIMQSPPKLVWYPTSPRKKPRQKVASGP
jgi:hypothetical protein